MEKNEKPLLVGSPEGRGTIILSLSEYNSMMETIYLLRSEANAEFLKESIEQIKQGKTMVLDISEIQ